MESMERGKAKCSIARWYGRRERIEWETETEERMLRSEAVIATLS